MLIQVTPGAVHIDFFYNACIFDDLKNEFLFRAIVLFVAVVV